MIIKQTSLDLNGPILTILQNPVGVGTIVDGGSATFSGIATVTYVTNGSLGTLDATYGIFPNGIDQPDLVTLLTAIETKFEVVTALLDADATLTDTNYAALWDFDMDTTKIKSTGISQGAVVDYLNTVLTALNGVLVKLDADLA